jgi:hypothetical protein
LDALREISMNAIGGLRLMIACAGLLCGAICDAQEPAAPAAAAPGAAEAQTGDLYIFNDSGHTLMPSNQVVTDNGHKLVSLPRHTYVRLQVAPGHHVLKPDPPLWKQQVSLDVVAGGRYFVVVAYRPERSWAAPAGGAPLLLREITEEAAAPLLREMRAR